MIHETLNSQSKLANHAIQKMKDELAKFDSLMTSLTINVPEESKKDIESFRNFANTVMNLAKSGNVEKANELIKNFDYGRKNNE